MKASITCYWTVELDVLNTWKEYSRHDDPPFMEIEGIRFPRAFLRAVTMEGCGVGHGKTVVYEDNQWKFIDHDKFPMGIDSMGAPLIPYKTIAVDRHLFSMGGKYHICELAGKVMPDGSTHDGVVWAKDVGGRINEAHVDFYTGTKSEYKTIDAWLPKTVNIERLT